MTAMALASVSRLVLASITIALALSPATSVAAASDDSARAPPPRRPQRTQRSGTMQGRYLCGQGWTQLVLELRWTSATELEAEFDFHHAPTGVRGRFRMRGTRAASGLIQLAPLSWITRPEGYEMVAMHGRIGADGVFRGRIDHAACGEFTVTPSTT